MGLLQRFAPGPVIAGTHLIDVLVAWLTCGSKLFTQGWGDESLLTELSQHAAFANPPPAISVDWRVTEHWNGRVQRDGTFSSPLKSLPTKAMRVHVRAWSRPGNVAACVILAGSRDEGYTMRERVFGALPERGLDIYLLENPFYGRRRTTASASIATFSDHVLMNLGMVWEARALLEYLRDFYQKLTVAGYSMGGHMAAITAAVSPFPLACAAFATGASAAPIYTEGLLSWSVDFDALASESHLQSAASQRLRQLIETADLTRHPLPARPDAAVIVGCARDGYVLRAEIQRLHEYWPGSILRWLPAGHVTGIVANRPVLRNTVVDASGRL